MAEFPAAPISPAEFFEKTVTALYAESKAGAALAKVEVTLGVRIDGEGGGEWLYHLRGGELAVSAGSRAEAAFTLVQSVEDWRGALWEGRGGVVGQMTLGLLRAGAGAGLAQVARRASGAATPELFTELAELDGLLRAIVTGDPAGDWSAGFKFGPGDIPAEPTTRVSIHHADAEALARRELKPLEAFLAGRISVAGDVLFLMQLQAIVAGLADPG